MIQNDRILIIICYSNSTIVTITITITIRLFTPIYYDIYNTMIDNSIHI